MPAMEPNFVSTPPHCCFLVGKTRGEIATGQPERRRGCLPGMGGRWETTSPRRNLDRNQGATKG